MRPDSLRRGVNWAVKKSYIVTRVERAAFVTF
jgi:hypothetical protein